MHILYPFKSLLTSSNALLATLASDMALHTSLYANRISTIGFERPIDERIRTTQVCCG